MKLRHVAQPAMWHVAGAAACLAFASWSIASAVAQPAAPARMPPASLSVREAHAAVKAGEVVLVDIRRPDEWADTGVAAGAIRLDMTSGAFEARLASIRAENPGKPIALICRTANRTRTVQDKLTARGWQGLVNVRGGMLGNDRDTGWLAEKLPLQ